jgi:hypothetical protein
VANATVHKQEVYSGSRLLANLNFQWTSGSYKNFTRMSPSEFKFLINLIGEKISKRTLNLTPLRYIRRTFLSFLELKMLSCQKY